MGPSRDRITSPVAGTTCYTSLKSKAKASNPYALSPAFGMITGALVMHATLVTRANGVWASVHAFVGDGENSLPRDPYVRVLEIIDFTAVGFEIMVYMTSVLPCSVFRLSMP